MKAKIVHLNYGQSVKADLVCKPSIGDNFPLVKMSDRVVNVVFVTRLVVKDQPDLVGCDLLIFVE